MNSDNCDSNEDLDIRIVDQSQHLHVQLPHLIYVMTFLSLVFLFLISPSLNLLVRFYSWIVEGMVRMITLRNSDGEVFVVKEAMAMES
ncbi:hypothetical protein ZIOFF_055385 [Zingiber officinale]|uniref:Transmembrane protein n=1 Tax=Zingiber officinale TaxID=94328 RepID=A0A8J5FHD7_ZINOF|nr:hypothetical protein ZIOFF_055385 [Zingiber officinale]